MRKKNDRRDKLIIKEELLEEQFRYDEIKLIIDNDKELIKMWKGKKLSVLDAS